MIKNGRLQTQVHNDVARREARITCTCANIIIADLGLRMSSGSIVYLSDTLARKSQDLMRAARAGGVTVHFVTRTQQIRQPVAVVGRPKRESHNLVARVSPVQQITTVFTPVMPPDFAQVDAVVTQADVSYDPPGVVEVTSVPLGLVSIEDVLEVSDDPPAHKPRKKKPTDG